MQPLEMRLRQGGLALSVLDTDVQGVRTHRNNLL